MGGYGEEPRSGVFIFKVLIWMSSIVSLRILLFLLLLLFEMLVRFRAAGVEMLEI